MDKKKKKIIIIASIVLVIIALIIILIANLGKEDKEPKDKITTTTTKKIEGTELTDEVSNISVIFEDSELAEGNELKIENVSNVSIEDVVAVYDIKLVDSNDTVVKVENANLRISIPYKNTENYNEFKVLYLSDNNEVLETLDANYINGKVVFTVKHLSKYAIKAKKVEKEETTTTTTTKKTTTTTTKKADTTTKPSSQTQPTQPATQPTQPATQPTQPATQPTQPATQPTQPATQPTQPAPTQKICKEQWVKDTNSTTGQYYLYVVDSSGAKTSGSITLKSNGSGRTVTRNIGINGELFEKDLYTVVSVSCN